MNNEKYIATLRQALAGMDRLSREEILREIQSYLEDVQDTESLESRFGPVEELARQYLDGGTLPQSISARLTNLGKKAFLGIGAVTLSLILLLTGLAWLNSGDRFDYANEMALADEVSADEWLSRDWSDAVELEIVQAHTVLYWHDKPELRWSCKGRDELELDPLPAEALKLRHGFCLLFLPPLATHLNVTQSDVVMIRPRASVDVDLNQASLRIVPGSDRHHIALRDIQVCG